MRRIMMTIGLGLVMSGTTLLSAQDKVPAAPAQAPEAKPVQAPAQAPAAKPVQAPAQKGAATQAPTQKLQPVQKPVQAPTQKDAAVQKPAQKPTQTPVQKVASRHGHGRRA